MINHRVNLKTSAVSSQAILNIFQIKLDQISQNSIPTDMRKAIPVQKRLVINFFFIFDDSRYLLLIIYLVLIVEPLAKKTERF